ncbi:MAG: hypothetical protein M1828_001958 [Chrysothrix sp. TS-e1954]|nr:MAG: hypothetical protein M1828_001958 [Chrysothrix sp. TS-e1954]
MTDYWAPTMQDWFEFTKPFLLIAVVSSAILWAGIILTHKPTARGNEPAVIDGLSCQTDDPEKAVLS